MSPFAQERVRGQEQRVNWIFLTNARYDAGVANPMGIWSFRVELGHVLGGIYGVGFWFILERILEVVTTGLNTAFPDHITWFVSIKEIVFGCVIVLFLIFEPDGLSARWRTIRAYWKLWPFSY